MINFAGFVLHPFSGIGTTLAVFQQEGNVPVLIYMLNNLVTVEMVQNLRNFMSCDHGTICENSGIE